MGSFDRIIIAHAKKEKYVPRRRATIAPMIDPADYSNDTEYLNAIPGMAESIIKSMNAPMSEFDDNLWDDDKPCSPKRKLGSLENKMTVPFADDFAMTNGELVEARTV